MSGSDDIYACAIICSGWGACVCRCMCEERGVSLSYYCSMNGGGNHITKCSS